MINWIAKRSDAYRTLSRAAEGIAIKAQQESYNLRKQLADYRLYAEELKARLAREQETTARYRDIATRQNEALEQVIPILTELEECTETGVDAPDVVRIEVYGSDDERDAALSEINEFVMKTFGGEEKPDVKRSKNQKGKPR